MCDGSGGGIFLYSVNIFLLEIRQQILYKFLSTDVACSRYVKICRLDDLGSFATAS